LQSPGALMRIGPRNNDSMTVATGRSLVSTLLNASMQCANFKSIT
jgi:hypothetical protein